jgi:hypothetical protein
MTTQELQYITSSMSLEEYKSQEKPVFMPHVVIKKGEYSISHSMPYRNGTIARVWIDGFDHEYALLNNVGTLWTTDGEGNPRRPSCFNIY